MSIETIGARIRTAREAAGDVSARELSLLAGAAASLVSAIELGTIQNPTPATLDHIAGTLGVSLEWLIRGTGDPPTPRQVQRAITAARARKVA